MAVVVQVSVRPEGVWHTQPEPKPLSGVTPLGTVWVSEIAPSTGAAAVTLAVAT